LNDEKKDWKKVHKMRLSEIYEDCKKRFFRPKIKNQNNIGKKGGIKNERAAATKKAGVPILREF